MARLVIELGGNVSWTNEEGAKVRSGVQRERQSLELISLAFQAADSLMEDYPHVALYLRSLEAPSATATSIEFDPNGPDATSSSTSDGPDLEQPTDALLDRVRVIMEASERGELSSQETDDRLRAVVEEAVTGQVEAGRVIGERMEVEVANQAGGTVRSRIEDTAEDSGHKRSRADEAGR